MPEIISIESFPPFNIIAQTELTADTAEGATSLPVLNEQGFDATHAILIGEPGSERSEIVTPSAVADESITVGACDNAHKEGEKVYLLRANKARVYRAANVDGSRPTSTASYSLLGSVTLRGDQLEQEYSDATGSSDYWYVYTFYNDIPGTPQETDIILIDAVRGGGYSNYTNVDAVRIEAGLVGNRFISDAQIHEQMVRAESEVSGSLIIGGYGLPLDTVPPQVQKATELLAAGYLLVVDYGPEYEGLNKDGEKKIKLAREILKGIEAGGTLVGVDGGTIGSSDQVRGYPDDTAATNEPSEDFYFKSTDEY